MKLTIHCEHIHTNEGLHELLAILFDLPPYYGKNLDAFYDCLSERTDEIMLQLNDVSMLQASLGKYADAFCAVCQRISEENPNFRFLIKSE